MECDYWVFVYWAEKLTLSMKYAHNRYAFQSIMKFEIEKKSICNLSSAAQLSDTLRVLESIAFDLSLILKKPINQNKYCIDIWQD